MPTKSITKKVAKKSVVSAVKKEKKQSAPKKKTAQFKALVCAVDGECFWTQDGRILQNLADLQMAFGSMDDEVFLHHVTKEKNDFADWVEYVLQDIEIANGLRKAKKKAQAEKILKEHLSSYGVM